ncbi:MAG TPA: MFS transporter [Candidatus Dormibacteraeota bacterium]
MAIGGRLSGLLRHPDFLKLWTGQSVSLFGSQVTRLALPFTAILTLHATPGQMGILGAVQLAPFLLLGLFVGVWVDRLHRRPILIVADIGRALLLSAIPVMALTHTLRIEYMYAVGFLLGTFELFFDVAYMSFLPSLIEREQLVDGNSMLQMSDSVAQVAGPGLGGALVQLLTAPLAILVDALTFLVSAISIVAIGAREEAVQADERRNVWSELREGLKLVIGNPLLRAIGGCTATLNLSANALFTVYMLYCTGTLGLKPAVIGAIFAVGGLSTVAGTLLASRAATRFGVGPMLIASPFVIGLASLLIPLAGGPALVAVLLLIAAQVLFGIGRPIFDINQLSLRQAITPARLQGRVNASMLFIMWGVIPIGSLLGGLLGTTIGLRPTLTVGAVGMSLAFIWVLFSPIRGLRRQPSGVTQEVA